MDIFSEDKETDQKEETSEENKSLEADLPEVNSKGDDEDYYFHFQKSIKSVSKDGADKAIVTQKTDNNGTTKTISEEFSDLSEAKRYFDGLSHDMNHDHSHPHEMAPMNIPVIELDGVEISAKTKPLNDLLVFADHLDKIGQEGLADKLFIVAEKLEQLFKK